ncbi:MAG: hypothetical protein OXE59_05140 [Bacteroidetes bacterium]|nr:hypothetical protein [Bacteroidota bacterium]MCY4233109.1 hypothetical protein [Bacteroidota bacterium]
MRHLKSKFKNRDLGRIRTISDELILEGVDIIIIKNSSDKITEFVVLNNQAIVGLKDHAKRSIEDQVTVTKRFSDHEDKNVDYLSSNN